MAKERAMEMIYLCSAKSNWEYYLEDHLLVDAAQYYFLTILPLFCEHS